MSIFTCGKLHLLYLFKFTLKTSEVTLKMWEEIFHLSKFFGGIFHLLKFGGEKLEGNVYEPTPKPFLFFLVFIVTA